MKGATKYAQLENYLIKRDIYLLVTKIITPPPKIIIALLHTVLISHTKCQPQDQVECTPTLICAIGLRPRGGHIPLCFVTTCDNGVFSGGVFMHLLIFFPALFVDIKLL
jgi:hypothetical protein